jgi:hypothetical protein
MLSVERVKVFLPEMHLLLSDVEYNRVFRVSRSVWELTAFRASCDESRKGTNFMRYWTEYQNQGAILSKSEMERLDRRYGHLNFFTRTYALYIELRNQYESFPLQALEDWHAQVFSPSCLLTKHKQWTYDLLHLANGSENRQLFDSERKIIQSVCNARCAESSRLRERFDELVEQIESPSAWEAVLQTFPADSDGCFGMHYFWLTYSVRKCIDWVGFRESWRRLREGVTPERFERIQELVKEMGLHKNLPAVPC